MLEAHIDCISLDATETVNLGEMAECCGMTAAELEELVDYKALIPLNKASAERIFSAHWVMSLRTVSKLRVDFDLDIFTVAMVLSQIDRIAQLERQVQSLRALLPSHLVSPAQVDCP